MPRLIDADALLAEYDSQHEGAPGRARKLIEEAPTVGGWISVKDAASIIVDILGDNCACDFNDNDEWLPQYCEYRDTDCQHLPETACWEQYIKHLAKKPDGESLGKEALT